MKALYKLKTYQKNIGLFWLGFVQMFHVEENEHKISGFTPQL